MQYLEISSFIPPKKSGPIFRTGVPKIDPKRIGLIRPMRSPLFLLVRRFRGYGVGGIHRIAREVNDVPDRAHATQRNRGHVVE